MIYWPSHVKKYVASLTSTLPLKWCWLLHTTRYTLQLLLPNICHCGPPILLLMYLDAFQLLLFSDSSNIFVQMKLYAPLRLQTSDKYRIYSLHMWNASHSPSYYGSQPHLAPITDQPFLWWHLKSTIYSYTIFQGVDSSLRRITQEGEQFRNPTIKIRRMWYKYYLQNCILYVRSYFVIHIACVHYTWSLPLL